MRKKFVFKFAVFFALLSALIVTGCSSEAILKSTKAIAVTGIPSQVTYIIVEAMDVRGAAVLGGNLNVYPYGKVVNWTPIENGSAVMELYPGAQLTAYLEAARKGNDLPPLAAKKEVGGAGTVLALYADDTTNGNPTKKKIWGSSLPLKFDRSLILMWEDGKNVNP
ncbi:MAG: hypothetical protein LBK62_06685 [Treponema sp.]|jgi:hypothetical protein|nr:hypothetical protein [Treponema sp.]